MKQGWEYKKLNEVCEKGSSNIVISKLTDNDGDYPLYGASGLVKHIDFYHQDKPYIGIVKDGAGVGRVNIYPAYSSLVGTMQYIFPKKDCLLNFIKYFLVKLDLSHCVSGATIPHIYFKDYGKDLIPVPSLKIQEKIVSELDKINELIRLKKEQLKDYDDLAQSIFYEMFGDPVGNEKGWEVKKMKDVCTHIVDCPHSTPKKADTTTNYPCIRTSELKGGTISWNTMQYLEKDEYEKRIARLKPETGDIVFGREGTIGDAVILPSGYHFCLGQRTMLIRTDNEMIINTFMHRTLMSEWIKHQIEYVNVSSTVAHVNIKDFKLFDVPLPPLPLQHLFAQRIEQIERQKSAVQQSITDLETLLASRMQYWFE
ncbi:restriction endonuclease subunit S [Prevotella sp.]|uniref:restriction endonuclease subunit S n=1 Tax=Prevotella sp. TaxID=59823 RepID=UPI002ABDBAFB|nr:restriction endonuclease subunit S [Prevotella sp.]